MAKQYIIKPENAYTDLDTYLNKSRVTRLFLVCGSSIEKMDIWNYFKNLEKRTGIHLTRFSEFTPNPVYESVVKGVHLFNQERCDGIIAVGGGSAMDVAKCVKLFSGLDLNRNFLEQKAVPNTIPFLAVPTTAGTGSEATHFAVIYFNGEKQSVADESCIPTAVMFQEKFLDSLPVYQKKATFLDALCHGIEAFWSLKSTEESRNYSKNAIKLILENKDSYLSGNQTVFGHMFSASYQAGKAINLAQTTAGHAMSYKLTSLYGIAHGHAAALCVQKLWPYMAIHPEKYIDPRGSDYVNNIFLELADLFGSDTVYGGAREFDSLVTSLNLQTPVVQSETDFSVLVNSVNLARLKNNPVLLNPEDLNCLYHEILGKKE